MEISQIHAAGYNPRKDLKPGDPEYEKLRRSIEEFGYVDPLIWNETTGNIVGGHQRFKVLAAAGFTELDCVVVNLDPPHEKALNIALNKIQGGWDDDQLTKLLQDLDSTGFDVSLTGFSEDELLKMFPQDAPPGVNDDGFDAGAAFDAIEKPYSAPGDVWALGRHRHCCAATLPSRPTWTGSWMAKWQTYS